MHSFDSEHIKCYSYVKYIHQNIYLWDKSRIVIVVFKLNTLFCDGMGIAPF